MAGKTYHCKVAGCDYKTSADFKVAMERLRAHRAKEHKKGSSRSSGTTKGTRAKPVARQLRDVEAFKDILGTERKTILDEMKKALNLNKKSRYRTLRSTYNKLLKESIRAQKRHEKILKDYLKIYAKRRA